MKRKKILGLLFCLFCALFALTLSACGDNTQNNPEQNGGTQTPAVSEGLQYTLLGDKTYYAVTGRGTCTDTDIIIPSTYEGLPVKSIADYSFKDFTLLSSIVIPTSVTSIGFYAFSGCNSLASVTIPDSVTSIGNSMFSGCSSLTSVTIPNSVTSINDSAFSGCGSLTSVTIPNSVTSISDSSFEDCSNLTSVTIPDSVTSIGFSAFSGCISLTSVTIPDSVTSIGYMAFYHCSSLTSVTIPFVGATKEGTSNTHFGYIFGAKSDDYNSFYVPSSLKTIFITGGTSIGFYAFRGCNSLASVTILDSVTSIGFCAFSDCSSLTSVTIPDSVTSIDYGAFSGCSSLTSVTIPDSVTSIGSYAFSGCSHLSFIYYTGTKTEWNNITIGSYIYDLTNTTRYYYSETEPALNEEGTGYNGKYWHYAADGVTPVVWKKENRTTENTLARV